MIPLLQVAAPKKLPKKKEEKDNAEKLVPKTEKDLANEKLQDLLSGAEKARTNSLKLSGIQYAKELSGQCLKHAEDLEKMFKELTADLKAKDEPKTFVSGYTRFRRKRLLERKRRQGSLQKPFAACPFSQTHRELFLFPRNQESIEQSDISINSHLTLPKKFSLLTNLNPELLLPGCCKCIPEEACSQEES